MTYWYIGAFAGWGVGIIGLIAVLVVLAQVFREHPQVRHYRSQLGQVWKRARFHGIRWYKRSSQLALLVAKPPLLLSQRLPAGWLRHLGLFLLFVVACCLPYVLRLMSVRLAAFVQIFWSLCVFGVGLSMAWLHFLVEKELDAIAHGLLGRERKRYSEVPLARYTAFEHLVGLWTLGVACLGMMLAFAFLVQGLYDLGFQRWYVVHGQPSLLTWILYTTLSVFRALDIFDIFATFRMSVATVHHQGAIATGLVFVFKAIFDILLIAKIRDWWSKRNLAMEAIAALTHNETRNKAEETLRRCRKSAISPLLEAYQNSHDADVKTSILRLLQELSYADREHFFLEALQSKEEDIRHEAIRQLGVQGTLAAVEGLHKALGDPSAQVRAAATEGLAAPAFLARVTPMLLKALRDPAGIVREKAAASLKELASPESRLPLIDALQDKEASVRKEVVRALAGFEQEIFSTLAPMFCDPNPHVRLAILKAIAEQLEKDPDRATSFLLEALRDDEQEVRIEAISHLHWNQSIRAIPFLGDLLQRDKRFEVRQAAAAALGYMETRQAVEPLLAALQDRHYLVRCAAIEALGDLRAKDKIDHILALTDDHDRDVRKQAVKTLGELRAKTPRLIEVLELALDDIDEEVRAASVEALAELTDGKAPALVKAIQDPHILVRVEAINVLSSPVEAGFLPLLFEILQDNTEVREVRKAAIVAFSYYNLEDWESIAAQVQPLLQSLLTDDDIELRKEAIAAIGSIGFAGAYDTLQPCLQSDDSEIRLKATEALNFIDGPEVVTALITMLCDDNLRVRAAAAAALSEHAERQELPQIVSPLLTALRDDEQEVRKQAALALAQVKAPEALRSLLQAIQDQDKMVRRAAAEALGLRNHEKEPQDPQAQQAIQALLTALQDKEDDVRVAAAEGLGEVNTSLVIAALCDAMRKDPSDWVRLAAVHALQALASTSATEALQEALLQDEDEWIRAAAAETLGDLKPPTALPLLLQSMREDTSPWTREYTIKAIVAFADPTTHAAIVQALHKERHVDVRKQLIHAFDELQMVAHKEALQRAFAQESEPKLKRQIQQILRAWAPAE